jgi:hypothetical protein
MYKNDVTTNYLINFTDSTHFYPQVGDKILCDIFNDHKETCSKDFGILINHDNYEHYMNIIEKQFLDKHHLKKDNLLNDL